MEVVVAGQQHTVAILAQVGSYSHDDVGGGGGGVEGDEGYADVHTHSAPVPIRARARDEHYGTVGALNVVVAEVERGNEAALHYMADHLENDVRGRVTLFPFPSSTLVLAPYHVVHLVNLTFPSPYPFHVGVDTAEPAYADASAGVHVHVHVSCYVDSLRELCLFRLDFRLRGREAVGAGVESGRRDSVRVRACMRLCDRDYHVHVREGGRVMPTSKPMQALTEVTLTPASVLPSLGVEDPVAAAAAVAPATHAPLLQPYLPLMVRLQARHSGAAHPEAYI